MWVGSIGKVWVWWGKSFLGELLGLVVFKRLVRGIVGVLVVVGDVLGWDEGKAFF